MLKQTLSYIHGYHAVYSSRNLVLHIQYEARLRMTVRAGYCADLQCVPHVTGSCMYM
jgi:hypothetical protein